MKLEIINRLNDKQQAIAPQKKEKSLDSSQRKISGHTLFEYNTVTMEIKEAVLKTEKGLYFAKTLIYNPSYGQIRHSLVKNPFCIYMQALNKKNFIKMLKREGFIGIKTQP